MRRSVILMMSMLPASAAVAEVSAVAAQGFESRHAATIAVSADAAYRRFVAIETWWADAHTYGGDATRLSLDARAGGCWCERLDGGGVEHLRVVYVDAGRALRLEGGLGPLQELGVRGVLTIGFEPAVGGTQVSMVYRVGGWREAGFADLAPVVDQVLAQQFARFVAAAVP